MKASELAPYTHSFEPPGRGAGLPGTQGGVKKGGVHPAQTPSDQWGPGQGQGQDKMGRCRFKRQFCPWLAE